MGAIYLRLLPFLAFLGTAVGAVFSGQQVNLSLMAVLLVMVLSVGTGCFSPMPLDHLKPLMWFFAATLPGTVLYGLRGAPVGVPLMQYGGMLVCWMVVWRLFRYADNAPEHIFKLYLMCATASAAVAVCQQAAFQFRIELLYDLHWLLPGGAELDFAGPFVRVPSLFSEPSYFAAFLIPALYLSVRRLTGNSTTLGMGRSVLFISALMCTFSTIGYFGLLLCVLFALRLSVRNLMLGALLVGLLVAVAASNPALVSRLSSIPSALQSDLQGDENLSALINGLNLAIASGMLGDRPLAGTGLGAYRIYSMDYLESFLAGNDVLIGRVNEMLEQLTLADGGSMYLRLSTEMGLLGMAWIGLMVWRHWRATLPDAHREIATASALFILVFSIRSGQLVRFDIMFFCALFALVRLQPLRSQNGQSTPAMHQLSTP